jgi:hypothetical protein
MLQNSTSRPHPFSEWSNRLIREAAWPSRELDAANSLRVFLFLQLELALLFDRGRGFQS